MELLHKEKIIELFNTGKLKLSDAQWYEKQGYAVICNDGKVTDIVKEV